MLLLKNIEKIELVSKELQTIVNALKNSSNGLSSGEIALIAAGIGASTAITSHIIIFLLTRAKEKNILKKELIAEERRLAYLLHKYHEEYIGYLTLSKFWAKVMRLQTGDTSNDSFKRHFEYDQRARETKSKIHITQSEYFKIITHFNTLIKLNPIINNEIGNIESFSPRKTVTYVDCKTTDELYKAQDIEYKELCIIYDYYKNSYENIHQAMIKKI